MAHMPCAGMVELDKGKQTRPIAIPCCSLDSGEPSVVSVTSLEGICAPARADSDAPSGLTSSHREAPSSTLA